jgi:hypothetical protein
LRDEMKLGGEKHEATVRYTFARGTVIFDGGEYRVEKATPA